MKPQQLCAFVRRCSSTCDFFKPFRLKCSNRWATRAPHESFTDHASASSVVGVLYLNDTHIKNQISTMAEGTKENASVEAVVDEERMDEEMAENENSPPPRLMITKIVRQPLVTQGIGVVLVLTLPAFSSLVNAGIGEFQKLWRYQTDWTFSQMLQFCCWSQWIRQIQRN